MRKLSGTVTDSICLKSGSFPFFVGVASNARSKPVDTDYPTDTGWRRKAERFPTQSI